MKILNSGRELNPARQADYLKQEFNILQKYLPYHAHGPRPAPILSTAQVTSHLSQSLTERD